MTSAARRPDRVKPARDIGRCAPYHRTIDHRLPDRTPDDGGLSPTADRSALLLGALLDGVILATGADMGNVQLLDATTGALYIHAHRGFMRPFLQFFERVEHASDSACGAAAATAERVVVPDVCRSPMFDNIEALDVLLAAEVRAVQSSPLMSSSGELVGVLSTHYAEPRRLSENDHRVLDMLVANSALWTRLAQDSSRRTKFRWIAR